VLMLVGKQLLCILWITECRL